MSFDCRRFVPALGVFLLVLSLPAAAQTVATAPCNRVITAKVVALDVPFFLNRLGAMMPEGMVYALERDVVPVPAGSCTGEGCPKFMLRPGKRPRPIVLRANEGDCLDITFTNRLTEFVAPYNVGVQTTTRYASIHVAGMQMLTSIDDDGSFVGVNNNSLAAPGETKRYRLIAREQGTFLLNSEGAPWGGLNQPNDGAQVTAGLFGAVNVEPPGAVWLRSQITNAEMLQAVDKTKGNNGFSPTGQPFLDFGSPVLNMLQNNEIVSTDLTAVIAGPPENGYMFKPDSPTTAPVPYEPDRTKPFREFTIEYHELNDAQQAFPVFDYKGASLTSTLQAAGDAFAINYGSGGIGAEILANRFGIGPMNSCADCRFEEFFLSSWTVGDPAMVVDYPANAPCTDAKLNNPAMTNTAMAAVPCTPGVTGNAPDGVVPQRKATKTLYPDDPSNVYHSYINDRVIFRTIHAGTGVSHVHHLHAHQWFHSPNADGSTYLDSQLINPGSAYTMEIAHLGSGNLNKVVGDSIFHCHFYPHFGAGMWAHWRSHDVFEIGTKLDANGKPLSGWNRAQPDGEIAAGTPIPAIVPMPGLAMAPAPARVQIVSVKDPNNPSGPVAGWRTETHPDDLKAGLNPGFPFFIPGVGGTRAPHPPMDFAVENGKELNGGLPRHILLNANISREAHNYLNFEKDVDHVNAYQLPEQGTPEEQVAMKYHAQCWHDTFNSLGPTPAKYRTNGLPPVSGAPFSDPAIAGASTSDECKPVPVPLTYKAAVVQTDFVINKLGWHYPQSRLLTLWGDVLATVSGAKPPEPFFIRANAETGVNYWHTNLVPAYYLMDDYQVRTPTDIIGQHIHLVKFDVTSSDGAANGFNYEDGTLSYQEVQELIEGINECGGLAKDAVTIAPCTNIQPDDCKTVAGVRTCLTAELPPAGICPDPNAPQCQTWKGAQTTVQRWLADSLTSPADKVNGERTLRTVFTHDHFGPSTHQQVGLYAAFMVEPKGSKWFMNNAGRDQMGTRFDGGPTSWEAIIETPNADEKNTYREFALALQDFQFAYQPSSIGAPKEFTGTETTKTGAKVPAPAGPSWADPANVVEPAAVQGTNTPGPQIISAGPTSGTLSFNYRNEPLPQRVATGSSNDARATDLAYVFNSNVTRNNPKLNVQPTPGSVIGSSGFKFPATPLTGGMEPGDPYTPLLRAYEGDRVQVRVIVGAHMLPHAFTMHGMKWLFEPSFANSGYRSTQSMGISEHFEFLFQTPRASPSTDASHNWSDYLYMPDASNQKHGIVDGMWGIFRAYKTTRYDLPTLSTNKNIAPLPARANGYSCPPDAPVRAYTVNAASPNSPIIFNSRGVDGNGKFPRSIIENTYPLLYQVQNTTAPGGTTSNLTPNTVEPLVLRANAGDCVVVTLRNTFNTAVKTFTIGSTSPLDPSVNLLPSKNAGITPQLMSYDVMNSMGSNVGFNPDQVVPPGGSKTYYWYAGQTNITSSGTITGTPMELAVNLTPADPLEQDNKGLVGGLIVEPKGSVVCFDNFNPQPGGYPTYASAWIYDGGTCNQPGKLRHREFVAVTQDDNQNLTWSASCYCPAPTNQTGQDCTPCMAPVETAIAAPLLRQTSINYRTEPMAYRFNATRFFDLTATPATPNGNGTIWRGFSDGWVLAEPQTPIFAAARNTPTRMHLLHPGGSGDQQVLALHGHVWQELPYVDGSTAIGDNTVSQWLGARDNYGTNMAYTVNLSGDGNGGAGGVNGVVGDYIYRTTPANFVTQGLWGLMRVGKGGSDIVSLGAAQFSSGGLQVSGSTSVFVDSSANPRNGSRASTVDLFVRPAGSTGNGTKLATVNVGIGGLWTYNTGPTTMPQAGTSEVVAVSPNGGQAVIPISMSVLPGTPASAQPSDALGESIRFVNIPRPTTRTDDTEVPRGKPEEGLLAPPTPGVPQAPKSEPDTPPSNQ